MSMTARHALLVFVALSLAAAGCSSSVRKPQLLHPGPAPYQRQQAVEFDPYPQNDVGPEIVGGRPPDFAVPPNEVDRAFQANPVQRQVAAPVQFVPPPAPLY